MAEQLVHLAITPKLRSFLEQTRHLFSDTKIKLIDDGLKTELLPVSFLKELRKTCLTAGKTYQLKELLDGSSLRFSAPEDLRVKQLNPSLEERRRRLRARQEEKKYMRMMGIAAPMKPEDRSSPAADIKQAKTAIGIALNILIGVATGFAVFYTLSRKFSKNPMHHLSAGLVGGVIMLLVEVLIFMVKTSKILPDDKKSAVPFSVNLGAPSGTYQQPSSSKQEATRRVPHKIIRGVQQPASSCGSFAEGGGNNVSTQEVTKN